MLFPEKLTCHNPGDGKKNRKRKATAQAHDKVQSENKRKKTDIRTTVEKKVIMYRQRTSSKGIEEKDVEQPKVIEQEKETRRRRKRVRIMSKEEKPTNETLNDTTEGKMNTQEKDPKRNKLEHKEHDPPD